MTSTRRARWGRRIAAALGVLVLSLVCLAVVLSLRPVQRALWDRAVGRLTADSGWTLSAGEVRLGLLAGRLELTQLELAHEGATVAAADAVSVGWGWAELLAGPPRLDRIEVDGGSVDLRALPAGSGAAEAGLDRLPLDLLEIADFRINFERVLWSTAGVERVAARGLAAEGSLLGGRLEARVRAEGVQAERADRSLEMRGLRLAGAAEPHSLEVEVELGTAGGPRFAGAAAATIAAAPQLQASVTSAVGLAQAARWWNPELARRLEPRGELQLAGELGWSPRSGLAGRLEHRGPPVTVAGYAIEGVELSAAEGRPHLRVTGEVWGFIEAQLREDGRPVLRADFDGLPAAPAARRIDAAAAGRAPAGLRISGSADLVLGAPPEALDPRRLDGSADLEAHWDGGELSLEASAGGGVAQLRELELAVAGSRIRAEGRVSLDGGIDAEVEGEVPRPARLLAALGPWLPVALARLPLRGGPLDLSAELAGAVAAPRFDAHLSWQEPGWGALSGRLLEVAADGTPQELEWTLVAVLADDSRLTAEGRAEPPIRRLAGSWQLRGEGLAARPDGAPGFSLGAVRSRGRLEWQGTLRRAGGFVIADELTVGAWRLDGLIAEARLRESRFLLDRLELRGQGALLAATATLPLGGDGTLAADLRLADLDLGALPIDLPEAATGVLDAHVRVSGSVDSAAAELSLDWQPAGDVGPLPGLRAEAALSGGRLWLEVPSTRVAGGVLQGGAVVPLGDLPRPGWLWPEAPSGPLKASLEVDRVQLDPVLDLLGTGGLPLTAAGSLDLELLWALGGEGARSAEARISDLEVSSSGETLRDRELRIAYHDGALVLDDLDLEDGVSHLRADGRLDLASGSGSLTADLVAGPSWLRLLPLDLDATAPVALELELRGSLADPRGWLRAEQGEGELMVDEPPVQVSGAWVELELEDGVLVVVDGAATVNRGELLLGGEWNRDTGQGVIFGFEDVVFLLPEGILTRWDGAVVVEPAEERLARVIGELMMVGGLWDQDVDLGAALFGGDVETGTVSDLAYDVVVDLEVYGRGAVAVENNLGNFEVTWHVLDVEGTLAEPLIQGELILVPGGYLTLAGGAMEIARGSVRFPGERGVEPEIEIVPVRDAFAAGAGEGAGLDAANLLRRGVAGSVGSLLGLTNDTLRPATTAIETFSDPSTNYLISRQIGRYIALFVAADLSDVQQRTMLLQLYNWRALPGLALQLIEDTRGGTGGAVVEHYEWGGTVDERPRIRSITLEGDWPLGSRRLKRATGLHRGQPYDPFLVFVGRVRLERELARAGWYSARVDGRVSEDPHLPGLSFTVEPGPRQEVRFEGGDLPEKVRREATADYRPPPQEEGALAEMERTVRDYLDAVHHPFADVRAQRRGEQVLVEVERGERVLLTGPEVVGVAEDAGEQLARLLGNPSELAPLARRQDEALRRIERLLELQGYLRPAVRGVRLETLDGETSRVRVEAVHGGRATIGDLVVTGSDPLGAAAATELPLAVGEPLRRSDLEAAERRIRERYRSQGYVNVEVDAEAAGEGLQRTVRLVVDPGRQQRVADVSISGRRHLSESLVRRGVKLEEGDLVERRKINESIVELASFEPIARVDVSSEPAGPSSMDFEVSVTERPRWTVGGGARWSQETGLLGIVDLRDEGLFGRGFSLDLRGIYGSDRRSLGLIAALPRPPGGRWSTSLTLSYSTLPSETEPDRVRERSRAASVEATVRLREGLSMRGYYLFDDTRSSSLLVDFPSSVERTVQQTTLGWQGVLDRLDDPFDPRRGIYLAADVGWSSPSLGGDVDALRTLLTASWATAPKTGWTWARTLRLGWARSLDDDPLEEQVRFFAGGESSIRGFDRNLVGPVVEREDGSLRPLGGGALAVLNEELRIPVWRHDSWGVFRVAVFADVGQVWLHWSDADFRLAVGAGLGLRWDSPLGPVWADVAWPLARVQGDDGAKFYLGLGRPF